MTEIKQETEFQVNTDTADDQCSAGTTVSRTLIPTSSATIPATSSSSTSSITTSPSTSSSGLSSIKQSTEFQVNTETNNPDTVDYHTHGSFEETHTVEEIRQDDVLGDFNDDGETDILVWPIPFFNSGRPWHLYQVKPDGIGFNDAIATNPGDFNGYGKTDLLVWHLPFSNLRDNVCDIMERIVLTAIATSTSTSTATASFTPTISDSLTSSATSSISKSGSVTPTVSVTVTSIDIADEHTNGNFEEINPMGEVNQDDNL